MSIQTDESMRWLMWRMLVGLVAVLCTAPAWAMENHSDTLRDERGRAIGNANVTVYFAGTSTPAPIYSDNGITIKANPFKTDALTGRYNFYGANNVYDIVFSHPTHTFSTSHTKRIALCDPTAGCGGGGGGGGGGSPSVGVVNALQASDGIGGFLDSGCSGVSGAASCQNGFTASGTGTGILMLGKGVAPGASTTAGEVRFYVNATDGKLYSHDNGGSAVSYVNNPVLFEDWADFAGCSNATAGPVFDIPAINPALPSCDVGSNTFKAYLGFNDTTDQSTHFKFKLGTGFTGAIDFVIRYKMATATTGTVGACVQLVRVATGSTDDPAFPPQAAGNCASVTVPGTAGQHGDITINGATCGSCVAGDLIYGRVTRDADGSAVSDTATGDARFVGMTKRIRRIN